MKHTSTSAGRLVATPAEAWKHDAGPCLLSPMTARLPPRLADLSSSLPIGDANGELLESLRGGALPEDGFAGVLANDPFRLPDDLLGLLVGLGCTAVANWPSTALLSGELAGAVAHSGLGYDTEMAFLARARERGFRTLAVITQEEQLPQTWAAQPSRVLVAAGLAAMVDVPLADVQGSLLKLLDKAKDKWGEAWIYEHEGVAEIMSALRPYASATIRHT